MDNTVNKRVETILWSLFSVVTLFFVWMIILTVSSWRNTGVIYIKSTNSGAGIIVEQENKQLQVVGSGSAKVRLKAGKYQVIALLDGMQSNAAVTVDGGKTINVKLSPVKSYVLPSPSSINFQGTNALVNHGLTNTQISDLEQAFFNFNKLTKSVVIDTSSIKPGAYNPNVSSSINVGFNVEVDSSSYRAVISYAGLDDLDLKLYNASNNQIFDSGVINLGYN